MAPCCPPTGSDPPKGGATAVGLTDHVPTHAELPVVRRLSKVSTVARGTFEVDLKPGPPELDGSISRFELSKTFHGDLEGVGAGVMLSHGDPRTGSAGYVAIETVSGHLGDRHGSFALQQFGTMRAGSPTLHYEIVPGSGEDELEGISGTFRLKIEDDGTHRYELEYES